jgi:hypothetical protein
LDGISWFLINREERVLHPVGKKISITPGAVHELKRLKALRVIEKTDTDTVYSLSKKWDRPLKVK